MRIVQQATERPFRCAVLPYIGNSNSSGWIDTGCYLDREKVYVSFEGAGHLATQIGWVAPSQRRELEAEVALLRSRIEALESEVGEADKFAEAAEYTLAKFGQRVQRKPGRPKERVA